MQLKALCPAVMLLIAGCTQAPHRPADPVAFRSLQEAYLQVCAKPSSHPEIETAVRALSWTSLIGDQIPRQVAGNGMVTWTEVAEAPDRGMIVASGHLNGTSFCRVYSSQAPAATLQAEFEHLMLLGRPLGRPYFNKLMESHAVIGWHRSTGKDWRALHLSTATSMNAGASELPTMLEMTRPKT